MFDVSFLNKAGEELMRLVKLLPIADKAGHKAVAQRAKRDLNRGIDRVYSQIIPMAGRRAAWKRSGALRRAPQTPVVAEGGFFIAAVGRAAESIKNWPGGYIWRRSKLGVTWFPRRPAGARRKRDTGIVRKNDYIGDTQKAVDDDGGDIFEATFKRVWR